MAVAVVIFGTPDGFDSSATGDPTLSSSGLVSQFELLSFAPLSVPIGTRAWGLFKRTEADGVLLGVCKLCRAREHKEERPGGYIGAGFLFRDQIPPFAELMAAIDDLMASVSSTAFGDTPYKFLAPKFSSLQPTTIPENCRALEKRLSTLPRQSGYAAAVLSSVYLQTNRVDALKFLLSEQDKFASINILLPDDQDLSYAARSAGLRVGTFEDLREWALEAELELKKRESQARALKQRQDDEARAQSLKAQAQSRSTAHSDEVGGATLAPQLGATRSKNLERRAPRAQSLEREEYPRLLILLCAIVATAIISALVTYVAVSDPGLRARHQDARERIKELQEELEQQRQDNRRLAEQLMRDGAGKPRPNPEEVKPRR